MTPIHENKHLESNGFRVEIHCDGEPLPVYQVTSGINVRYYIPSQAGEDYEVRVCAIDPASIPHDGFGVHLYTEGCSDLLAAQSSPMDKCCSIEVIYHSIGLIRPLMFSSVETTENEEGASAVEPDKIGLLDILVWYTRKAEPTKRSEAEYGIFNKNMDVPTVHERSGKAGFNVTALGKAIHVDHDDGLLETRVPLNDEKHPQAAFRIFHQPLAMLQAAGIAPAPAPQPTPAPAPPRPLPRPLARSSRKRPSKKSRAEAGPSKRTRTGSAGSRRPSPPLLYEALDDSGNAEARPTAQPTRSARPPTRLVNASGDDLMDLGTGPVPVLDRGVELLAPQVRSNARIKRKALKRAAGHDGEDVQLHVQPPASRSHNSSKANTNADIGPTTRLNMERHSQKPSREGDVKPRFTMASTSRITEDVKPQITQTQTSILDRATELRAQIVVREIRIKRLAEEEQLAKEKAELAKLEAQTRAQERKVKQRERMYEANEVVDLTTDN